MGHLSELEYDDRWDDQLDDPLDDGTMPLGPGVFDPLTELHGEPWPKDALEAAGYEYEIAHWLSSGRP